MNKASYYQTLMQEVDKLDNLKDIIELLKLRLHEYKLMTPLEKMKYKDWLYLKDGDYIATQIEFYEDKLKTESKPASQGRATSYPWTGTPDRLKEVVFSDYIQQFNEIERQLHERPDIKPFLSKYRWQQQKTALCELLVVIIELGWTKKSRNHHVKTRRFFESRYGYEKNALAEMFKPSKRPEFEKASITFHFIDSPVKTN